MYFTKSDLVSGSQKMLKLFQHDRESEIRYNIAMILLVDFGSQTAHLIARRVREQGVRVAITEPEDALEAIKAHTPKGIIFSGGPSSVYEDGAPTIDPKIFDLNIPILAICYGFQLVSLLLKGKVVGGRREYGPATLQIADSKGQIVKGIAEESTVWMSHGDAVEAVPDGF